MIFKRVTTVLIALCVICALPLIGAAEDMDDDDLSHYAVEDDNIAISDDMPDDTGPDIIGTVTMPHLSMYTGKPLYRGKVVIECALRSAMHMDSKKLITVPKNGSVEILDIEPDWVLARYKDKLGYLKRFWLYLRPETIDPATTPPYGVYKYNYVATCAEDTPVQKAPGAGQDAYLTLSEGARIAIIDVHEGWGRFYYWHGYGYVDMKNLKDFASVSPTDTPIGPNEPIAAYTSYYKITTNVENVGRMKNIAVASERISRVYQPGEVFDFNKQVGPYRKSNGYFPAPVLVDGSTAIGYGGGTCQVSSTMYNVLLQLPGISILNRRPHQQSGAVYLPVGMDAAVGTDALNLRFQNNYHFPIRMEAVCQDGALTMVVYRADSSA